MVNPDGSRVTNRGDVSSLIESRVILFVGDSFTFGERLDDEETLP